LAGLFFIHIGDRVNESFSFETGDSVKETSRSEKGESWKGQSAIYPQAHWQEAKSELSVMLLVGNRATLSSIQATIRIAYPNTRYERHPSQAFVKSVCQNSENRILTSFDELMTVASAKAGIVR